MLEATNEPTIMDFLNEDCWRAILKYVPNQDLIRTEHTSRHWQTLTLQRLKGVRLSIEADHDIHDDDRPMTSTLKLRKEDFNSFALWTCKLGPSIVAAPCYDLETMKTILNNCPNLERLEIMSMTDTAVPVLPYNLNKDFKCLKSLHFHSCHISDKWINDFIAEKALEELEVNGCQQLEGAFLRTINLKNLKSLTLHLREYGRFDFERFLSAVEHLGGLTKLVLTVINRIYRLFEVETEIQYVLDQMPKLEYLEINNDGMIEMKCKDYGPLSRLTRLQYLQLGLRLSNRGVDTVLRECKELRSLCLSDCSALSSHSFTSSLRKWGKQLRSLTLDNFEDLMDHDIVAIIAGCPELMSLKLPGAKMLSQKLPEAASRARHAVCPGVPLRLEIEIDRHEIQQAQRSGVLDRLMVYEDLDLNIDVAHDYY